MRPIESAFLFVAALGTMNARQEEMRLPRLVDQDLTLHERCREVHARLVNLELSDRPRLEDVESAGAALIALHQSVFAGQLVDVSSGEEAA